MRIFILLGLLCVSASLFAEESQHTYTIEELLEEGHTYMAKGLRQEDKCGFHSPYVGYKFTQEEIDALLEQWLPLHQEWVTDMSFKNIPLNYKPTMSISNDITVTTFEYGEEALKYIKDPRRINLCGADLSGLFLLNKDLSSANLSYSIMLATYLSNVKLVNADLSYSSLENTQIVDSDLTKVLLENTSLVSSQLDNVNLKKANLSYTNLTQATIKSSAAGFTWITWDENNNRRNETRNNILNLTETKFLEANLSNTTFLSVDLNKANLTKSNLSSAEFFNSSLTKVNLTDAILSNANFNLTNFSQSTFLPSLDSSPNPHKFAPTFLKQKQLFKDVSYYDKEIQSISPMLISLRDYYRKNGMREVERNVTNIIQVGYEKANWEQGGWASIYSILSKILFNWTTAYGLEPFRAINILLVSMLFFTLIYWFALRIDPKHNQFEIIWQSKIKTHSTRHGITKGNIEPDMRRPFCMKKSKQGWWHAIKYELKVLSIAFYVSLMYAFHIGWRQYNVGTWIRKLQHRDFSLQIRKGWIRIVSGVQSLMGLYLLVIWAFTQYGRPFE
ncbi:pentapeptide repeat-containing protein [Candidatus Albibeggiatoa sp. nov. BB20]|uniref:pentapeptide repeat-containing protein n=1 Tax=Candidatus Albibeggiatoa sp. nov. BB20 TaxID=3162723 RepID=UPI00336559B2